MGAAVCARELERAHGHRTERARLRERESPRDRIPHEREAEGVLSRRGVVAVVIERGGDVDGAAPTMEPAGAALVQDAGAVAAKDFAAVQAAQQRSRRQNGRNASLCSGGGSGGGSGLFGLFLFLDYLSDKKSSV